MPIRVRLMLLTTDWKSRAVDLEQRLRQLATSCPGDDTCEIRIAEDRDDPLIHATILRRRRTMAWNDWQRDPAEQPDSYEYHADFGPPDPSVDEIAESVNRMLRAPENPV